MMKNKKQTIFLDHDIKLDPKSKISVDKLKLKSKISIDKLKLKSRITIGKFLFIMPDFIAPECV